MPKTSTSLTTAKSTPPPLKDRDRSASEALSSRYDTLNELFTAAETRLKRLRPMHPVWVQYNLTGGGGEQPSAWEQVGLYKVDDKWKLVHAYDHELNDDAPPYEIKPITECTAEIRVEAAEHVAQLYEEIVKQKEEFIPKVEQAIATLQAFCTEK